MHFADKIIKTSIDLSPICVGIDPVLEKIPEHIKKAALEEAWNELDAVTIAFAEFGMWMIDAMQWLAWICKPQIAFFEKYWSYWVRAYEEIVSYAKKNDIIVITDWKRNDIGTTAEAYAQGYLDKISAFGKEFSEFQVDALTINPYLGTDSIKPFLDVCKSNDKGIFVLVKTSNPSAYEIQDLPIWDELLCEEIARLVSTWWQEYLGENYYSSVWAVIGATNWEDVKYLRSLMPNQIFLVPGYWAQWGSLETIKYCFVDWIWAIINSSRNINYAYLSNNKYSDNDYIEASREEIITMRNILKSI